MVGHLEQESSLQARDRGRIIKGGDGVNVSEEEDVAAETGGDCRGYGGSRGWVVQVP